MKRYGINSVLLLFIFIFGAVAGRILFDPSVELHVKVFVVIFSVFFTVACLIISEFLDEREFEQWKQKRGYTD